MRTLSNTAIVILSSLLLLACPGPKDGPVEERPGPDQIGDLKSRLEVDLSTTKGFVIGENTLRVGPGAPVSDNTLLAIDSSGELIPVAVSTSEEESVLSVRDTLKYVVLEYEGVRWQGRKCPVVLLRKSDSALFCVETALTRMTNTETPLAPLVQTDSSGDLLFLVTDGVGSGGLTKLDMTDAAVPTQTELFKSSDEEGIWRMLVNSRGDALVALSSNALRLYRSDGQVQNLTGRRNRAGHVAYLKDVDASVGIKLHCFSHDRLNE